MASEGAFRGARLHELAANTPRILPQDQPPILGLALNTPLTAASSPAPPYSAMTGSRPAWGLAALTCLLPLLLTLLLHMASQRPPPPLGPDVMHLQQGWLVEMGGDAPPDLSQAAAQRSVLPLNVQRGSTRQPLWLVLPFDLTAQPEGAWALQVTHRRHLLVYLDGQLLAQSVPPAAIDQGNPELKLGSQVLHVNVPPAWLVPGRHELQLRLGAAEHPSVTSIYLGPAAELAGLDAARGFWNGLRAATVVAALMVGLFLIGMWMAYRDAPAYALAGAQLLLLALLLSPYLLTHQLLPSPGWRMLLDVADVVAKALLLATVVRMARPHDARAMRWALAYGGIGSLIDGSAAALGLPWNDFSQPWPWWALGSRLAVLTWATAQALRALARNPRFERAVTAVLVGLTLCIWAYVSFFALVLPGQVAVVDLNGVAYGAWVLWMGGLLYRQFVRTARREREQRDQAGAALAERTRELQASFAALQASERQRMAAAERERLLQEMHDGLGSQLMTAKMNAQTGLMSHSEMASALDSCIHEMRLTVDTLSVTDGDLGLLLASVRHRSEPGLRAAGLTLVWQVVDAPCLPILEGTGGRELVRIVQEAINNVLHHAQATRVTLRSEAAADGHRIVVRLIDNGLGLPAGCDANGLPCGCGRGTRNMQQRAYRLGARLSWQSPAGGQPHGPGGPGTEVRIELPLRRP
jgi:signal transduction histidine kinase